MCEDWRNSPGHDNGHYDGLLQPIEYFVSAYPEFITASIIKYLFRFKKKGEKLDLEKAKWYIDWLSKSLSPEKYGAGDFIASNMDILDNESKEIILDLEMFEYMKEEGLSSNDELLVWVDKMKVNLAKLMEKYYG